jgi:hypothetical protein
MGSRVSYPGSRGCRPMSSLAVDAHSFFLAALDQIHAHAKGQLSSCNCIARKSAVSRKRAQLT